MVLSYSVHCTGQRQTLVTNIIAAVEQLMQWNASGGSGDQILEMITYGQYYGSGMFTDSVVKSKNDCHMMALFYNIHYTIMYVLICYELNKAV